MIKPSTLYSWVHKGSIPFHKLNGLVRFDMDDIETWVKSTKQQSFSKDIRIKKQPRRDIDEVVRKAIDGVKENRYNLSNGKPGQMQGLRRED